MFVHYIFTLEMFDVQCLYIRKNVSDMAVYQCHYIFILEQSVVIDYRVIIFCIRTICYDYTLSLYLYF